MTPVRTLAGGGVLLVLVILSGLLLWPAHQTMLDHRRGTPTRWTLAPLRQGASFARSQSDVYSDLPLASPTPPKAAEPRSPRARRAIPLAQAEKILLQKGGRHAKEAESHDPDDLSAVDGNGASATGR